MENRRWDSNDGRKNIHARKRTQGRNNICARKRTQGRDNIIASQHPSRRAWREIEDNRVGCQELLVARNNKRGGKIYGWM